MGNRPKAIEFCGAAVSGDLLAQGLAGSIPALGIGAGVGLLTVISMLKRYRRETRAFIQAVVTQSSIALRKSGFTEEQIQGVLEDAGWVDHKGRIIVSWRDRKRKKQKK